MLRMLLLVALALNSSCGLLALEGKKNIDRVRKMHEGHCEEGVACNGGQNVCCKVCELACRYPGTDSQE